MGKGLDYLFRAVPEDALNEMLLNEHFGAIGDLPEDFIHEIDVENLRLLS